jgi:hypothetical protein
VSASAGRVVIGTRFRVRIVSRLGGNVVSSTGQQGQREGNSNEKNKNKKKTTARDSGRSEVLSGPRAAPTTLGTQ